MRSRRAVLAAAFCCMLALSSGGLWAQDHTPQPYSPDEFQGWMKDLYRAEVIFIGSIPFTLFACLETYGVYRYVSTGMDPAYAPWPFSTGTTINLNAQEQAWIIGSAIGLSLSVAVLDFMIGRWNATSQKR